MVITNKYLITIKALKITPYIGILHWKNEIYSICQNNIMKIVTMWLRPNRLINLGIVLNLIELWNHSMWIISIPFDHMNLSTFQFCICECVYVATTNLNTKFNICHLQSTFIHDQCHDPSFMIFLICNVTWNSLNAAALATYLWNYGNDNNIIFYFEFNISTCSFFTHSSIFYICFKYQSLVGFKKLITFYINFSFIVSYIHHIIFFTFLFHLKIFLFHLLCKHIYIHIPPI